MGQKNEVYRVSLYIRTGVYDGDRCLQDSDAWEYGYAIAQSPMDAMLKARDWYDRQNNETLKKRILDAYARRAEEEPVNFFVKFFVL